MTTYPGWVAVATCADVTAALMDSRVNLSAWLSQLLAVLVVAVAGGLGVVFAGRLGGRGAVAGAMTWGLGWIAAGRIAGSPRSLVTGLAAVVAALVVLVAAARWHVPAGPAGGRDRLPALLRPRG